MNWNFDITAAPRGKTVAQERTIKDKTILVNVFQHDKLIVATKCGQVFGSRYLPEPERWEGLAKGEQPVAWMHWPDHPEATSK
jgi:hypothetical protein